jgi:FAD/FMN-containing dehydrogenase
MAQALDRAAALSAAIAGSVVTAADPDYDEARKVWNAQVDRRPEIVAKCTSVADVVAAVTFARAEGLEISVRAGAHNSAGKGVGDGGITIDVRGINAVAVDPAERRVRVGGGALLMEMDAATQEHGLAVPAGEVGHTGVGGLTLGGGMGWLTRQHGLSVDNLLSAQVVLADGRVVRAAADENADLFWALRGGGGNFGIVTEFEFQLHEVGPIVQLGMLFYPLEQGADALRLARDTIASLPPEVSFQVISLNAPPAPFVPEEHHFKPGFALVAIGFGSQEQHTAVVQGMRERLAPLFDMVTPMPYTALQTLFDEANAWGLHCYETGTYIAEITDEVIEVVTTEVAKKTSPLSVMHFYLLNGAYSQVADDATAFGAGRSPRLAVFVIGVTSDDDSLAAEQVWVRTFIDALSPLALDHGVYVNALSPDDEDRALDIYGPKYEQLAEIKAKYDPENVFHRNCNIRPAAATGEPGLVPEQRPTPQGAGDPLEA